MTAMDFVSHGNFSSVGPVAYGTFSGNIEREIYLGKFKGTFFGPGAKSEKANF